MFRKISTFASFGIESTTRKILDDIIRFIETTYGFEFPVLSSMANFDQIVRLFSQALDQSLQENGFSYKEYQNMSNQEKEAMRSLIAYYLFYKNSRNLFKVNLSHLVVLEFNIQLPYAFLLLPNIFYYNPQYKDENQIKENLINDINIPLAAFISDRHQKQLATLALGYADTHSMFAQLPKELINHIGHGMNVVHAQNRK